MAKYKIGDKVRVRSDLVVGNRYNGGCLFIRSMADNEGKVLTIKEIRFTPKNNIRFRVEESEFSWSEDMFEPIFKVGDKVKLRDDLVVEQYYGGLKLGVKMVEKLKGKTTIIICSRDNSNIILKDSAFIYAPEMLELVESADSKTTETTTKREETEMDTTFRIRKVKTIDNKVVIIEFKGGDVQKAVCMPGDTFDFEKGVEVCVMKHLLGKSAYYKALKDAGKQIIALIEEEKKAEEYAEMKLRQTERDIKRKKARAERKRAARVAEMKEAYLAALKEYNGNIDFDADDIK